jgi:hypothetical protein
MNLSIIFKLWYVERPPLSSSPIRSSSSIFSTKNSNPPFFNHKSSFHHHKFSYPNTQSVNITILIQLVLGFLISSKQNYPFLFELNFKMLICISYFCNICSLFVCLLVLYIFFHRNMLFECMICLKFLKKIFVCNLMKLSSILWLRFFVMK